MFGITIPPGVDMVRILALSGRQGKPPCLWEGPPAVDQASIEAQIAGDGRVVRWLRRNGFVKNGIATLHLQFDFYSQGKKVDAVQSQDVALLLNNRRRSSSASDEVTIRAFDLAEAMVDSCKELLAERDTVIGRLVERGLKSNEKPPVIETAKPDFVGEFLEKGSQFVQLAKMFRELKEGS